MELDAQADAVMLSALRSWSLRFVMGQAKIVGICDGNSASECTCLRVFVELKTKVNTSE
jgi:hypothetical protein